jgi:hypothetical protein
MAINWKPISSDKLFGRTPPPAPSPAPAPTPALTTTPINVDLREPRGSYRPSTRKTKDYSTEGEVGMKKGGLVKKKTTMKKKK